jgi:circadian clock protein KaiC
MAEAVFDSAPPSAAGSGVTKRTTGIAGLDAATHGGLPAAGTTLVMGAPGTGKTVIGLEILARAAERGETGIAASFEEPPEQLRVNATAFSWGHHLADDAHVALIDARPQHDAQATGHFDLNGLVAVLSAQVDRLGASWLVLDGLDRLLRFEPDEATAVAEVQRLDDWCREKGLTAILTAKDVEQRGLTAANLAGVEYMLSTILVLSADLIERRLNRRFRILKYRGTAHVTDELPLVIDSDGIELPAAAFTTSVDAAVTTARVSSGVPRLDRLLGGGYYAGSSVLISGNPGTAKTSLGAAFAASIAERGQTALLISFDEPESQIVRNMQSIGIDLAPHVASGRMHVASRSPWGGLLEEHFLAILALLDRHTPHALVLDPVSALLKAESGERPLPMLERLLAIAKTRGITTLMTSLSERETPEAEATLSHVSTIADTWISLSYQAHGGERNRALSVVKSRGAGHSNQVRELLLSAAGIDLADVYEYGSEVLMGTARVQKQSEAAQTARRERLERERRRSELDRRLKQAEARIAEAESEKERIRAERNLEADTEAEADAIRHRHDAAVRQSRDADERASDNETGD